MNVPLFIAAVVHGQSRRLSHIIANKNLNFTFTLNPLVIKCAKIIPNGIYTPLSFAICFYPKWPRIVNLLLENGANPNYGGLPALNFILRFDPSVIQNMLYLPLKCPPYQVVLPESDESTKCELIWLMLTKGKANPNLRTRHVPPPILDAARRKKWDIVKMLLYAGAYPQFKIGIWGRGFESEFTYDLDDDEEGNTYIKVIPSDESNWYTVYWEKVRNEFGYDSLFNMALRFIRRNPTLVQKAKEILPWHYIRNYFEPLN